MRKPDSKLKKDKKLFYHHLSQPNGVDIFGFADMHVTVEECDAT